METIPNWKKPSEIPHKEGLIVTVEQKNSVGHAEQVEARVAIDNKSNPPCPYFVETKTCLVVRGDRIIRWFKK